MRRLRHFAARSLRGLNRSLYSLLPRRSDAARAAAWQRRYFAEIPLDLPAIRHFRRELLPDSGPAPWLDRADAGVEIERRLQAGELDASQARQCRHWAEQGYVILPGLFEPATLDRAWAAYKAAAADGRVRLAGAGPADPWPDRALNPHRKVAELAGILGHAPLLDWLRLLVGREPLPYQTLCSHKGTQQEAHSDSIHMTTYPLGYLNAAWIAFEDIHPDSGPLFFHPRSHRLPYLLSNDVGIGCEDFRRSGYDGYGRLYEPAIQAQLRRYSFPRELFLARKGDVLLWHANLIHGGSRRRDLALSRKAVVCHYFTRGAVCYHDLSGTRERIS